MLSIKGGSLIAKALSRPVSRNICDYDHCVYIYSQAISIVFFFHNNRSVSVYQSPFLCRPFESLGLCRTIVSFFPNQQDHGCVLSLKCLHSPPSYRARILLGACTLREASAQTAQRQEHVPGLAGIIPSQRCNQA